MVAPGTGRSPAGRRKARAPGRARAEKAWPPHPAQPSKGLTGRRAVWEPRRRPAAPRLRLHLRKSRRAVEPSSRRGRRGGTPGRDSVAESLPPSGAGPVRCGAVRGGGLSRAGSPGGASAHPEGRASIPFVCHLFRSRLGVPCQNTQVSDQNVHFSSLSASSTLTGSSELFTVLNPTIHKSGGPVTGREVCPDESRLHTII